MLVPSYGVFDFGFSIADFGLFRKFRSCGVRVVHSGSRVEYQTNPKSEIPNPKLSVLTRQLFKILRLGIFAPFAATPGKNGAFFLQCPHGGP